MRHPIDPVEQTIAAATSFGSTSPEAIAQMRQSLRELYGTQGGLLTTATITAWCLGNLLCGLAGYYPNNRILRVTGLLAMGMHPVPYYIVALPVNASGPRLRPLPGLCFVCSPERLD